MKIPRDLLRKTPALLGELKEISPRERPPVDPVQAE